MKIDCPTCKKKCESTHIKLACRPFCSDRCQSIDLGRWLDEDYRVSRPANPDEIEFEIN